MSRFHSASSRLGPTVSFKKTEVLTNRPSDARTKIKLNGKALKITSQLTHLGGILSKNVYMEEETKARIATSVKTCGRLCPRPVSYLPCYMELRPGISTNLNFKNESHSSIGVSVAFLKYFGKISFPQPEFSNKLVDKPFAKRKTEKMGLLVNFAVQYAGTG
ncbi:hypothetical protein AAMO2058_001380600 [Amorphochlora amoebiformis]